MQVGLVDRAERGFDVARPVLSILSVLSVLSRLYDLGASAPRTGRAGDGRGEVVDAAFGDEFVGAVEQAGQPPDGR